MRYLGRKYGDEKERIFSEADIFVFPTYYDNDCLPLVLLEAMVHGLPCVTTTEGGIRDIVDNNETGFVIENNNPDVLADALSLLFNDQSLRQRMGERGFERYCRQFTQHKFENKLKGILVETV